MPTFDVPTEGGTYRVEATSPKEAYELYQKGQGTLLPPVVPRPGPGENPVLAPPKPSAPDATVYVPPAPPTPTEKPLLEPVFNWIGETVAPAAWDIGKKGILPTLGSAGLNYGGPYLPYVGPALAALPPQARESIGSVLGTGANMALGIEEPSLSQLALSAVSPGATRKGAQVGTKLLPGAQAGRATGLLEEVQALPERLSQGLTRETAGGLFDYARKVNPRVAMDQTRAHLDTLLASEAVQPQGLKFRSVEEISAGLQDMLKQSASQGGPPLAQLDAWRQRIGAKIDVTKDTEEQRALKSLYGSLLGDLEAAAPQVGGEGAAALLKGIEQSRRVFSADDLKNIITDATSKERPVDGLQTVDFGRIKKTLERPRTQEQTLLSDFLEQHPEEKAEIVSLLDDMNRRNVKLLPPAGAMYGSGALGARAGGGYLAAKAINAAAGTEVLDPATTATAVGAGSLIVSRLMLTPTGRSFLKQMYAETGTLNVTQLLTQFGGQVTRANVGPPAVDLAQRVSTRATGFPGYPGQEPERKP
jgi:hypothetical protein